MTSVAHRLIADSVPYIEGLDSCNPWDFKSINQQKISRGNGMSSTHHILLRDTIVWSIALRHPDNTDADFDACLLIDGYRFPFVSTFELADPVSSEFHGVTVVESSVRHVGGMHSDFGEFIIMRTEPDTSLLRF